MPAATQPRPRIAGPARALWVAAVLTAGCGDCGGDALQVTGERPHVRCLAAEPPAARSWQLGELRLRQSGRELELDGLPDPSTVAAFSGPGPGAAPSASVVAAMVEQKVHLAVMLGGAGDLAPQAAATVAAMAKAPFPTLVLAGGRDEPDTLHAALSGIDGAADRVLPIAGLRAIRIGQTTLVPVAGAPDGSYARTDGACGFTLRDLQEASAALGHPAEGERRFLLGWQAPGRGGPLAVARDPQGLDLGDDAVAEFAARVGAPGGLFAWPMVRPLSLVSADGTGLHGTGATLPDGRAVVPRLTPPAADLADGALQPPGFAVFALGTAGIGLRAFVPTPLGGADAGAPDAD